MPSLLSAVLFCLAFGLLVGLWLGAPVPLACIGVLVGAVLSQVGLRPTSLPRARLGVTASARPLLGADGAGGRGRRHVVRGGSAGQDEPQTQQDTTKRLDVAGTGEG